MGTVTLGMPFDSPSPPDGQPPRSPRPGTNIKGERAIDPSPLSSVLATRLVVPPPWTEERRAEPQADTQPRPVPVPAVPGVPPTAPDRKSTRLNSSHSQISYAVFCLKKKKKKKCHCCRDLACMYLRRRNVAWSSCVSALSSV